MLSTFCASVNFRSVLLQNKGIPSVDRYLTVFNNTTRNQSGDEVMGIESSNNSHTLQASNITKQPLSERATKALESKYLELFHSPLPSYTLHSKYYIDDVSFSTRIASKDNCNVIFRSPGNESVPGIIQFIISITKQAASDMSVFFIIEWHAPLPSNTIFNPFSRHMAFGANLWSSKMEQELEVVPLSKVVCHSVSRPWVNGILLIKELNRVSVSYSTLFSSN